ncbi:MAG: hypothetical protein ACJAZF_000863 [Granulosicoccus sp.]
MALKLSPLLRLGTAAGIYLMVMWGYSVLPTGQWFAAFLAIMMSIMLVFWVTETVEDVRSAKGSVAPFDNAEIQPTSVTFAADPSLEASVMRLDSLKSELKDQYAQFGRDQSLLNSKSLGSWNGTRNQRM